MYCTEGKERVRGRERERGRERGREGEREGERERVTDPHAHTCREKSSIMTRVVNIKIKGGWILL